MTRLPSSVTNPETLISFLHLFLEELDATFRLILPSRCRPADPVPASGLGVAFRSDVLLHFDSKCCPRFRSNLVRTPRSDRRRRRSGCWCWRTRPREQAVPSSLPFSAGRAFPERFLPSFSGLLALACLACAMEAQGPRHVIGSVAVPLPACHCPCPYRIPI